MLQTNFSEKSHAEDFPKSGYIYIYIPYRLSASKNGRSCVLTEDWSHIADMTDQENVDGKECSVV